MFVEQAVLRSPGRPDPPRVLQLVGHPLRWRLLQELVRSDRAVAELTAVLEAPQSLVSYHLRQLLLFLCTGNSARSQMAEALVGPLSGESVDAASAGSRPKPLHPNAVRVMKERGIDISGNRTKHLGEFTSQRFDFVITLCDRVREVCPELPGHPDLVHWSIPDPALEGSTDRATRPAFERTASELETRIRYFLSAINEPSMRRSGHAR